MHPPRHEALIARKVGAIALGLFAHSDYLAGRGVPQSLADLTHHDVIGPDRARRDLQLAAAVFPDLARENYVIRADSHPAQLAYARAGLGIAVVQRPVGLADPGLVSVLPDLVVASLETWIVTHGDLRQVPRIRATFDHLVEAFRGFARKG